MLGAEQPEGGRRRKKLTDAELLPFWLCLRLGGDNIHPDHLLDRLTPGQWRDWERVHAQRNLSPFRDDLHWGILLARYKNAHLGKGEQPVRPIDEMPYADPLEEEMTTESMAERLGIGRLIPRT